MAGGELRRSHHDPVARPNAVGADPVPSDTP